MWRDGSCACVGPHSCLTGQTAFLAPSHCYLQFERWMQQRSLSSKRMLR